MNLIRAPLIALSGSPLGSSARNYIIKDDKHNLMIEGKGRTRTSSLSENLVPRYSGIHAGPGARVLRLRPVWRAIALIECSHWRNGWTSSLFTKRVNRSSSGWQSNVKLATRVAFASDRLRL